MRSSARVLTWCVSAVAVACTSPSPSGPPSSPDAGLAGSPEGGPTTIPACKESPAGAPDAGTWTGAPIDLPMKVTQTSSDGTMRFSLPVAIGTSPAQDVQLDTGSSGLRILEGAVPDSAFDCVTSTPVTYSYSSGLELTGVVAFATVSIGSIQTPGPIPVMLVQEVGCTAAVPNCSAKGKTPQDYELFGPYKAILGVGMRSKASDQGVGSAIAQLPGRPSFIVKAPGYGGTSGIVRIGPSAAQIALFKTFQLPAEPSGAPLPNGTPSYDDRFGLPACVDDTTSGVDYCVPVELDTGDPGTYIQWPADTNGSVSVLPAGSLLMVTIGPASAPLEQFALTVGATPTYGVDVFEVEPATGDGFMNIGTVAFFRYDILLDPFSGLVGLSAHSP